MTAEIKPEILLVDDNPADLYLFQEALGAGEVGSRLTTVPDGEEAIAFLYRSGKFHAATRPDLLVLDLNLPRKDGRAVLANAKSDPNLRLIPIVVFSTSGTRSDIVDCYALGANCYVSKPGSLGDFRKAVQSIEHFWLRIARTSA
jgi:two-component system, chemotaxis family, response regulator Rcp1